MMSCEVKMSGLYGRLVKKLPVRQGPGGALPDQLVWVDPPDLEGININFGGGFHKRTGVWHTWAGAHTHECVEILFFVGMDPKDISYLGGDITGEFGEEQEEHILSESSVIVVPKGLRHGPFSTSRLDTPYLSCHILMEPQDRTNWLPIESKPPKTKGEKYKHLFKPLRSKSILRPSESKFLPGNADQAVWFYGEDLGGLNLNFTWGIYTKCGIWHREEGASKAHTHPFDEILIFIGSDPNDIHNLGAEIEIDLGEQHERHIFNTSTLVVFPKGLVHGPVVTRWVDRPYGCFVISFNSQYSATWI